MRILMRAPAASVALALAFFPLLSGCSREPAPLPPDQRVKLLTIPDEFKARKNPVAATSANELEGATRYAQFCALCHGPDGKANTLLGRALYPRASDLTAPEAKNYSDGQLFWIISEGIRYSGMPRGQGLHTEDQMWKLVLYVRALQRPTP